MNGISQLITAFACVCSFSASAQKIWTLQECVDYAMEHNISVQQSEMSVERAAIDADQSKYNLLPSLNAGATHGYNWGQRIDPYTNQFASARVRTNNFFLSGSLNIFSGWQNVNSIKQSVELLSANMHDTQTMKNDIALQVCLAYLQVLVNQEMYEVANNQRAITQQQTDRMQLLVDAGQMAKGSLYDLQAQLAQEEYNTVTAQNQVKLSLLTLRQLMQLPAEENSQFEIEDPNITEVPSEAVFTGPQEIYNIALRKMPQVQAAQSRREAAEVGLSLARGQYSPSLSLSGTLATGYSGANQRPVGDGENYGPVPIGSVIVNGNSQTVYSITDQVVYSNYSPLPFDQQLDDNFNQNLQLQLNIPIINGMTARSNVGRAKVSQIESQLNYENISNQLRFDIEQAHADAIASLNQYRAAEKAVESLQEAYNYAEARYDQQLINTVEFNNTKTRLTSAQSDVVRAKYDYVFRMKILDFYQGNPIEL